MVRLKILDPLFFRIFKILKRARFSHDKKWTKLVSCPLYIRVLWLTAMSMIMIILVLYFKNKDRNIKSWSISQPKTGAAKLRNSFNEQDSTTKEKTQWMSRKNTQTTDHAKEEEWDKKAKTNEKLPSKTKFLEKSNLADKLYVWHWPNLRQTGLNRRRLRIPMTMKETNSENKKN